MPWAHQLVTHQCAIPQKLVYQFQAKNQKDSLRPCFKGDDFIVLSKVFAKIMIYLIHLELCRLHLFIYSLNIYQVPRTRVLEIEEPVQTFAG